MKILKETFKFGSTTILHSILPTSAKIVLTKNMFDSTGGELVIDRVDNCGNSTSLAREFVTYDSVEFDGKNWVLQNVKRGCFGSTAQAHATGAIVEAVPVYEQTNVKTEKETMLENILKQLL